MVLHYLVGIGQKGHNKQHMQEKENTMIGRIRKAMSHLEIIMCISAGTAVLYIGATTSRVGLFAVGLPALGILLLSAIFIVFT